MRGREGRQESMFIYTSLNDMVPTDHPLRAIRDRVDVVLNRLSPAFNAMYSTGGRPSIPPEQLLKALMLQVLYAIPSERKLVEHIRFNVLYRWFLGLPLDTEMFNHSSFSKNRERFERTGLIRRFFDAVVAEAIVEGAVSDEHFSVDGTLIQSWASLKSLRPVGSDETRVSDGSDDDDPSNPSVNFRGERRKNRTHRSLTDPQARLARKGDGQPALLCHSGHVLMENRNGLCMDVVIEEANGRSERAAVSPMVERVRRRHRSILVDTVGMDAGYAAGSDLDRWEHDDAFVPHVPMSKRPIRGQGSGSSARRRARRRMANVGYQLSQRCRKRTEEIFGWSKVPGRLRRAAHAGRWKIQQQAWIVGAMYNVLRLCNLQPAGAD